MQVSAGCRLAMAYGDFISHESRRRSAYSIQAARSALAVAIEQITVR